MLILASALLVITALTPGAIRPLTTAQVCAIKWGTDSRHVSAAMKRGVFEAYGIPFADRGGYVIDHKIPRELAGSDVRANLWPQRYGAAHVKDVRENALHRSVCAGTLTLAAAQQQMRHWVDP